MREEREPRHHKQHLIEAVAQDYPDADKVLVSFPEQWEFVQRIQGEETDYVASLSSSQEVPRRNHFHDLPPAINESLTTYTHYKLFKPWLSPILTVGWNESTGVGQVESVDSVHVQLKTAGQAQVWKGEAAAVLWECYILGASQEVTTDYEELRQFWQAVEKDIGVPHLLTPPYDPAFENGYTDFLSSLGYTADPVTPGWWRKLWQKN
jgi:hypothetical protein